MRRRAGVTSTGHGVAAPPFHHYRPRGRQPSPICASLRAFIYYAQVAKLAPARAMPGRDALPMMLPKRSTPPRRQLRCRQHAINFRRNVGAARWLSFRVLGTLQDAELDDAIIFAASYAPAASISRGFGWRGRGCFLRA